MTDLTCVHHINFVVADIDASVDMYQKMLGIGPFEYEALPERGVTTARVLVGGVWIVLVSPDSDDSEVGRFLGTRGEGFFLLSFGVEDLNAALVDLAKRGSISSDSKVRSGIQGWRVADLDTESSIGIRFHLTEVG